MRTSRRAAILLLFTAFAFASCGGGTAGTTPPVPTGNVSVYLTDTPSYAFDNAWVTVTQVWFHQSDTAPFDNTTAAGWVRFTMPGGTTINLAALSGDNNVVRVFDNLALAAGTYRQMLLFLEPTENSRTTSATAAGLAFNNQVDAGTLHAALRVPNAAQGIRVAGTFSVTGGALRRLAVDLNVGRDVLPFNRGTGPEFLLQPRPAVFDLDNAGAIVGFIDNAAAADNTALFEVLAEQFPTGQSAHVVRRAAAIDNATGRFVLYPLAPSTPGQLYDIVIRGVGWRTVIVTSVPVTAGSTPASGATILGTATSRIPMTAAAIPDFRIAASITATTGALASFHQILGADPPYVIRQANFDPFSGTIADFPLSSDPLNVAPFIAGAFNGGTIVLSPAPPTPANGNYFLVAEAPLYGAGSFPPPTSPNVTPSTIFSPVVITGLTPALPAVQTAVGVSAALPIGDATLDNVVLFATYGGTILNALPTGPATSSPVTGPIGNLPGGAAGAPFPAASYGISAYGWLTTGTDNVLRVGPPGKLASTQTGDAIATFTMQRAPAP